jgi:peptide/nickel transport system substrate-binding protein
MKQLTRREMLRLSAVVGAGTLAAACGATPTAAPTTAPAATSAAAAATDTPAAAAAATDTPAAAAAATDTPAAAAAATDTPAAATTGGDVPRNRTLIVNNGGTSGKFTTMGLINPVAGMNHQEGMCLLWDPLFYYSVFADKEIPWLAESSSYNADFTQLTIKLRKGTEWSDGQPLTSADVKFTIDTYNKNEKINYHVAVKDNVKTVETPDDQTVVITFNMPSPRFKFEYLSQKFDTGDLGCVLPMHALKDAADVTTVQGKDSTFPHSGMFNVTQAPEQYVYDIRKDWWGFKTGFQKLPDIQRVLYIPVVDMTNAAQRVVNNEVDATLDLRAANIRSAVQQNPKITTHTGKDEPLGYRDWWPNSLWMNTQLAPYSDPDVRWAMNYSIDRDTIDKVVYLGAKIATIFPYPQYPALNKYLDGAQPIADKLGVRTFDLAKTAERMTKAGFTKDGEGFWVGKDGKRINATIDGFESIHADIVPVLVEMLRKGGFEAAINFGNDAGQNMADGKPGLYMFGHGASVIDPYATLLLYHSKNATPLNTSAGNNAYARYKNPALDKLTDAIGLLAPGDPKIVDLFNQAITIYWTDMIDIPIIQWLHRIPYNQTYWTNWPTQDNPYLNGAFWHWTFPLLVLGLKAAQ